MVKRCTLLQVLVVGIGSYLEDAFDFLYGEVLLGLYYLDEGNLIPVVAVVDYTTEPAQQNHEGDLLVQGGVQQWS